MAGTFAIRKAAQIIEAGGIVAYPTEAVWGLGCDPLDVDALEALIAIKNRDPERGFILIGAELEHIQPFLTHLEEETIARIAPSWPGPVTWILPANPAVPDLLTGWRSTIAVRVTAHPLASALCRETDSAIVSTSANRSGGPAARNVHAVRRMFQSQIDYVLPGSVGGDPRPTEIRDGRTGEVLRQA